MGETVGKENYEQNQTVSVLRRACIGQNGGLFLSGTMRNTMLREQIQLSDQGNGYQGMEHKDKAEERRE